jgi:hypothetical protein
MFAPRFVWTTPCLDHTVRLNLATSLVVCPANNCFGAEVR